jgi:hypothetical protein
MCRRVTRSRLRRVERCSGRREVVCLRHAWTRAFAFSFESERQARARGWPDGEKWPGRERRGKQRQRRCFSKNQSSRATAYDRGERDARCYSSCRRRRCCCCCCCCCCNTCTREELPAGAPKRCDVQNAIAFKPSYSGRSSSSDDGNDNNNAWNEE